MKFKYHKLDNGLVLALQNTQTRTIAGDLRVNFGAYHERENERGLAHFLEHCLVIGGSEKYSPEESERIVSRLGYFNAFTRLGRTVFSVKMLPEDFELWLDFMSGSLFNPIFGDELVEGERRRVLREIRDKKSNPYFRINAKLNNVTYRGHPKELFILGDEDVVSRATTKKMRRFHSRGYNPNNIDIILAGNLPDNARELIRRYFSIYEKGRDTIVRNFPLLKPLQKKTIAHIQVPDLYNPDNPEESSAGITMRLVTAPETHPDEFPIRVMAHILGSGANSRFFKNIGLEKGLAYSTSSEYAGTYNAGILEINAVVPARKIEESLAAIFYEFKKMRKTYVSKEELEATKRLAEFSLVDAFDSNYGHVNVMEIQLDKGESAESIISRYRKVTAQRIREVANKYLPDKDGKYVLGISDPLKKDLNQAHQ